jgi:alkene monooxygenase beta subunit
MSRQRAEEFSGLREFSYIKPQGRRATEYEDLTLHIQQDPKQFAWAGWPILTPEGRSTWSEETTAVRSSDWWAFRDPSKMWQRPYVSLQAEQGRALERLIDTAKNRDMFAQFDQHWVHDVLAHHYAACAFVEYGLFRALAYAQREALSDIVGNACVFNVADKIRYAQEISLYGMELAQALPGFSDAEAKNTWLTDPLWQGARKNIEGLMVTRDWAEIVVATNLVFEPLVGELLRVEFFLRFAARNGDSITPAIIESAEMDWERNLKWQRSFLTFLLQDAEHAAHNQQVIQGWIDHWTPLSLAAARGLAPLFERPTVQVQSFAEAFARVQQAQAAVVSEVGLTPVGQ